MLPQKADAPTKPHIVDLATRTKELMSKSSAGLIFGGAMTQMLDVVQNIPMIAVAGHDFKSVQNALWSDGKPFTGLQIEMQGNAFTKGIIGTSGQAKVTTRSEPGKSVINQSSAPFVMTGAYAYTATIPYITCDKLIEVDFDLSAYKEGEGDYEVRVGPLDKSIPPITFKRSVSVSGAPSRYAERPSQAVAPGNPPDESEPQTQYEIQRRQAEQERNSRY